MTLTRLTPLKTSTPLRRKAALRARRRWRWSGKAKRPPGYQDLEYQQAVRDLARCLAPGAGRASCWGEIEFSHGRERAGTGLKGPDSGGAAKCHRHHLQWEHHSGVFSGWDRWRRRIWMRATAALAAEDVARAAAGVPSRRRSST